MATNSMDKSSSVAKKIVAAAFGPVREVEYGCTHVQEFMSSNPTYAEKLTNAFINLQNSLHKQLEVQTTRDPKEPEKTPFTTLRPTYLCLQCSNIASLADRDAHCQARKHRLSIESRSGCLWCALCNDFVYDPTFERIRIDQSPNFSISRKRKLGSMYPTGEEDKFVIPNSNFLSCLAGAPRGIWNLGQTCYLSVVLQAMIHNPLMRNYFLSSRHDTAECTLENCIHCALTASFTDILATDQLDGHGPVEMLFTSWKNHASLAGYQQQDAHEYFQALIDSLHSTTTGGETKGKDPKNCGCLWHQIFYGKLKSTVTCMSCRNVTVTEDPIVDLSLDLRQQAKRRKLDPKSSTAAAKAQADEPPLELTQCLKNFTSPEKLPPDSYTCRSKECGNSPQRARKHLTIKKLPPTLCIQLKRYEHNKTNPQKLDTKLTFPIQLDMSPYTARALRYMQKGKKSDAASGGGSGDSFLPFDPAAHPANTPMPLSARSPGWYDLSTVVVHVGKIDAGHYLCYCRRDDQWFKFDDSKVTLATEAQVLGADAYLLFYVVRSLGSVLPVLEDGTIGTLDGPDGGKEKEKEEKKGKVTAAAAAAASSGGGDAKKVKVENGVAGDGDGDD